ncbi:MAG TPA: endopeptidase La [bacterium]|nr:endopeptidase La [bacterium]
MFLKDGSHSSFPDPPGKKIKTLPMLPLRDVIMFPYMVQPLFVGREKSISALEEAMSSDKGILLVAQKSAKTNDPNPEDINRVGTVGHIIQLLRLPDGTVKVLVEGKRRARILRYLPRTDFFQVEAEEIEENNDLTVESEALVRSINATFETYVKLNKKIPPDMLVHVSGIEEPSRLADTIVAHLTHLKLEDKQEILEIEDPAKRLEKLYTLMQGEIEILQVEKKIRARVKKQMEKTQKEYYLNEQMRAIQKELGEKDEFRNELNELEEKLKSKDMPDDPKEKVEREIKKFKMMSPMSAEATVVRNYIDWMLALPWNEVTEEKLDIAECEKILDEDHFGLKKVKERIVEYLAVQKLVGKLKGPILCLAGPPGVGKTSLGKSIARATGRKFVRISLGGIRDEAEVRGHRRTYIGALPGKIVQGMRRAGSNNPVFLLDEIDKLSSDFRGDPSSALMEVLDPEQNYMFQDHYLDCDYDLSKVMFVCTANQLSTIPAPLQDRMEIIRLEGYTEVDKLMIGKGWLVPKLKKDHGLEDIDLTLTDNAISQIIRQYTRESGVRSLEREMASIYRKVARKVAKEGKDQKIRVNTKNVSSYLGVRKFDLNECEFVNQVGIVHGLTWTGFGGEIQTVEAAVVRGKGKVNITGNLGEVLQESAQAALSYIRSRAADLGLEPDFYQKFDIHIHLPEGAQPKEGPSAGIALATAIASAFTKTPVICAIAMTGEITLRGRVLPIGGLKEKLLAAHRAGIKTVLIPKANEKDLPDVPEKVTKELEIKLVEHMDQVLKTALVGGEALLARKAPPSADTSVAAEPHEGTTISPDAITTHMPN